MRQCSKPEGKRDIKHMAKWREVLRQKVTLDDAVLEFPKCEASHPRQDYLYSRFIVGKSSITAVSAVNPTQ